MGNEKIDEKLLTEDVAKQKLSIHDKPKPASSGLSKSVKLYATIGGLSIAGAIVVGIMTAGNKGSKSEQAENPAASDVGQTKPALSTFKHGAQKQPALPGSQASETSHSAGTQTSGTNPTAPRIGLGNVDPSKLDFDYSCKSDDDKGIKPVRVFAGSGHTYLQMPPFRHFPET